MSRVTHYSLVMTVDSLNEHLDLICDSKNHDKIGYELIDMVDIKLDDGDFCPGYLRLLLFDFLQNPGCPSHSFLKLLQRIPGRGTPSLGDKLSHEKCRSGLWSSTPGEY